ncbi:AI-2E family transporter [Acuticoccus sp. MNP-M23]|uniref:AI-2E family transporter n=1 Tax=Acuticoccus sp. MNP-M23 TaxID=3072793 RepID=UPI002814F416|nr:AI-2E family transporter [Acuticoccus sp. MNP-M23]WMS42612.1 AI-2E family transporter [Acuticoccus sp. MNP-M23]
MPDLAAIAREGPRWAIIGIFLIMLVGALGFARPFLVPVVLAFLLTLVFSPVRRLLDRRLPSVVSALLIVGTLLVVLAGGVVLLSKPIATWIDDAPRLATTIELKLRSLRGAAETVVEAGEKLSEIASGAADTPAGTVVVQNDDSMVASMALLAPGVVAQLAFVLVLLFFLLSSGDMIYEKIVHVMPTFRDKRHAIRIAYDIERKLSTYLFTITVINAALGATIGLVMWALGMPSPLLFGVIGFAFNFVPYVGAFAGGVIAAAVGLVSLDHLSEAAIAGGVYLVLTTVFGQFITPYFVSRQLRLNTVVVFLSVAMCAWLWSVVGMLIATPLLVTVRVFCEHIPPLENVGSFLSARGAESATDEEADESAA